MYSKDDDWNDTEISETKHYRNGQLKEIRRFSIYTESGWDSFVYLYQEVEFYRNGYIKRERNYGIDGISSFTDFYKVDKRRWDEGIEDSEWKRTGMYDKKGRRHGQWTWWSKEDEEGDGIIKERTYRNGKLIDPDGKIELY